MQKDELIISNVEQAKALQDTDFLSYFVKPASPSDITKKLNMSTNLVHHHAQKHLALELLFEAKREKGKVFYQLVAKRFLHARDLLPASSVDHYTKTSLNRLTEQFTQAYERSDYLAANDDPDWHIYTFTANTDPKLPEIPYSAANLESHPAHFELRTTHLTAKQYADIVRKINTLIEALDITEPSNENNVCSLAFLAFHGGVETTHGDSHNVSSFVANAKAKF